MSKPRTEPGEVRRPEDRHTGGTTRATLAAAACGRADCRTALAALTSNPALRQRNDGAIRGLPSQKSIKRCIMI